MKIINDNMKKRGINKFLQMKINKYLEYMFEENKKNDKDCLLFTHSLSQSLRLECLHEFYGKLLKQNKLFSQFSEKFLKKITIFFNETTFAPDDFIHVIYRYL